MASIAVVTGAAAGIGRRVCEMFAKSGIQCVVADLDGDGANGIVQGLECGPSKLKHTGVQVDVRRQSSVIEMFDRVAQTYARPASIVVNCAGIALLVRFPGNDLERSWDQIMDVNLKGTFLVSNQACIRMLEGQVNSGSIVNVASILGKSPEAGMLPYAASKGAIESLTRAIATEMSGKGIRCNAVRPGLIETQMTSLVDPELKAAMAARTPVRRNGKPEDVAELIGFLASEKSAFITGEIVQVSGGRRM